MPQTNEPPKPRRGQLFSRERPSADPAKAPGLPPGSAIHHGERRAERLSIEATEFDTEKLESFTTDDIADCLRFRETARTTWLHVTGLHEADKVAALGDSFGIHPLIVEDILNTRGGAKLEEQDGYLFVRLPLLTTGAGALIDHQQFALLLTATTVITFAEAPCDSLFAPLRRRLGDAARRVRRSGNDYLAWAVLDVVVDHYNAALEAAGDALDEAEDRLQNDLRDVDAAELYEMRRECTTLVRLLRPARDIAATLGRHDSPLFAPTTHPFLRDLYDHAVHAIESAESLREHAASLRDFHTAEVGNRMNQVMKVLTCVSTIFLPLTFLAGIYGMNFKHMPELDWPWAYPALWLAFFLITGTMLGLFIRKRWL